MARAAERVSGSYVGTDISGKTLDWWPVSFPARTIIQLRHRSHMETERSPACHLSATPKPRSCRHAYRPACVEPDPDRSARSSIPRRGLSEWSAT